ncbi:hypothetical protein L2D08_23255 [Domibacillus sp. PGB-M46]|uniref:hypothetical protein n=1 Tax=Domibacillus sp. PGB-M46 TaxID=2910255 RepID=UPI001F56F4C2|nr:hypothetical protein [Domibacillus sp. PGB-M46]MCI2257233.1 hypothetical protein [Domibacillus sp. PGB-M46]
MMRSGRIENFAEYSQFKSLKDFNNNIEMFLADHKKDFTKGELVAFKRLVRYAAKFTGVANAKIGTLLKAINAKANGYGISRSTFERMLKKAKQLGILTVKNTVKSKGGKGHNVYVFNTIAVLKKEKLTYCKEAEKPCESKREQQKMGKETNDFETSKKKELKKRIDMLGNVPVLDHSFVSDYVPKEFTQAVKPFFDDARTIEEYWKMVKIDTYHISRYLGEETILHTAIHGFKQMIGKLKKGIVRNPIAYFKGVIKQQFDEIYNGLPLEVFS